MLEHKRRNDGTQEKECWYRDKEMLSISCALAAVSDTTWGRRRGGCGTGGGSPGRRGGGTTACRRGRRGRGGPVRREGSGRGSLRRDPPPAVASAAPCALCLFSIDRLPALMTRQAGRDRLGCWRGLMFLCWRGLMHHRLTADVFVRLRGTKLEAKCLICCGLFLPGITLCDSSNEKLNWNLNPYMVHKSELHGISSSFRIAVVLRLQTWRNKIRALCHVA